MLCFGWQGRKISVGWPRGFHFRGGLVILENHITSSTPANCAPCKALSLVCSRVVDCNSHLFCLPDDPREFGIFKALSGKGSRSRGFKSHYPARGRKLHKGCKAMPVRPGLTRNGEMTKIYGRLARRSRWEIS